MTARLVCNPERVFSDSIATGSTATALNITSVTVMIIY